MPLLDRVHRPEALMDPRHAVSRSLYGVPIGGGQKQFVHGIDDRNTEQQNRVHQPTAVDRQSVQPATQGGAINQVYGQAAFPQSIANTRPALQGHVLATDPPLPNHTSSSHLPGAMGPVVPPHLQGVTGRSPSEQQQQLIGEPERSPQSVSNEFLSTPSCDFPSPTTLTTPFTMLTVGPGTPPTPPEPKSPEPTTGCTMKRVDSNFSGFSGLQMNSPTTSVTSSGSAGTNRPAAFSDFMKPGQVYSQKEMQAAQQLFGQQQYEQQQEVQRQNQLQQERLKSLMSFTQQYMPTEIHHAKEGQREVPACETNIKDESSIRPIQCEIKDPTRNSPRAEYCGYTQEQIHQQQRDFIIQQQQKYASIPSPSVSRRSSTAHPHGLPPSPQPLGPSSQSFLKGSGMGLGGGVIPPLTPFGPGIGMPPPPPFVPPMGMPGGVPPPGMFGMPGMPPLPGMLPF